MRTQFGLGFTPLGSNPGPFKGRSYSILYGSWLFFISAAAAIPGVTIAVPNTANYFQVKVTTPAQGIEKSG